jgi:transcriptional regulator with XRE-family HTH domain
MWWRGLTQFSDVLYRLLDDRDLSVNDFAQRAGITAPFVSSIRAGRNKPPLASMERWADILGLTGDLREYFLDLAALANTSPRVLDMFRRDHPAATAIATAIDNDTLNRHVAGTLAERARTARTKSRHAEPPPTTLAPAPGSQRSDRDQSDLDRLRQENRDLRDLIVELTRRIESAERVLRDSAPPAAPESRSTRPTKRRLAR